MVLQDDGLARAERARDAITFRGIEHDTRIVVEQAVVPEERARVLRDRIEALAERRERAAVDGVAVRGGDDVGLAFETHRQEPGHADSCSASTVTSSRSRR